MLHYCILVRLHLQFTAVLHADSTYCAVDRQVCFQTEKIRGKNSSVRIQKNRETETVVERGMTMRNYGHEDGEERRERAFSTGTTSIGTKHLPQDSFVA